LFTVGLEEKHMTVIPFLTTDQMREVDRAMIEDYHIELIQMMENAGRNLAHLVRQFFNDTATTEKQVIVLCGTGGNGGCTSARYFASHEHSHYGGREDRELAFLRRDR
jgi:NAD(P)H-hydrate repair Nnr-like enzyme with NAD(P)H-hydrate epimerase domain